MKDNCKMPKIVGKYEDKWSKWTGLNGKFVYGKVSLREMPIGYVINEEKDGFEYKLKLFDKFCHRVHFCPKCHSKKTYHARQMEQGCKIDNIWKVEREFNENSILHKKYDFCLDCHSEFIFEYVAFLIISKKRKLYELGKAKSK